MAEEKLRVGVIGANPTYGWGPRAHLPALVALPDVELVAVCTTRDESARASADKFGAALAFSDHRAMLREAELDAVAVSVKVPEHYRLTMDVLDAGVHVYTEWPLGANLREAEELAAAAKSAGVVTMVGLQSRCHPGFLRLKELIDEGYVGEVVSAHLSQFGSGILARGSDRTWQGDVTLGANTLTIAFGHVIDSMCMCLGEFADVSALVATRVGQWHETDTGRTVDVTSPDNVMVAGTLNSGAVVSAHVSSVPWLGSDYRLEVYGRDGTLVLKAAEHPQLGSLALLGGQGDGAELRELPVPDRLTWVPDSVPTGPPFNVAQMWSRFAAAIRSGERAEPDFDSAVQRHRLLAHIQHASDTGERQEV
jgi:predicted dehydrogenase